jgi:hypothetical protein
MGADFINATVPISRTRAEAIQALHELSNESIALALYNTNLDSEWDDDEEFWSFPEDADPQIKRDAIMPELEKYVTSIVLLRGFATTTFCSSVPAVCRGAILPSLWMNYLSSTSWALPTTPTRSWLGLTGQPI